MSPAQGKPSRASRSEADDATKLLVELLSTGEIPPGERLPSERALAARFGVGRTRVREALAALEATGIVETRVGAGSYLREGTGSLLPQSIEWGLLLGTQETTDLMEAREIIELACVALAAVRAKPGDLAALHEIVGTMERSKSCPVEFTDADVRFHMEIAAIAGNAVIARMLASIRSLLEVWIRRASTGDEWTVQTLVEHRRIVDSIASRDAEFARGAMRAHMRSASARLASTLEGAWDVAGNG